MEFEMLNHFILTFLKIYPSLNISKTLLEVMWGTFAVVVLLWVEGTKEGVTFGMVETSFSIWMVVLESYVRVCMCKSDAVGEADIMLVWSSETVLLAYPDVSVVISDDSVNFMAELPDRDMVAIVTKLTLLVKSDLVSVLGLILYSGVLSTLSVGFTVSWWSKEVCVPDMS